MSETYRYDLMGNVIAYTDPKSNLNDEGVTTSYRFDPLNRLILIKDALNQTTSYSYDGNGKITNVSVQAKGGTPQVLNSKAYNELGLLIEKKDAASQRETTQYNALGLAVSKTDRNGTVHGYQYDERQQLTSVQMNRTINNVAQSQETRFIIGKEDPRKRVTEQYENGIEVSSQSLSVDSLGRVREKRSKVGSHQAYLLNSVDSIDRITRINDVNFGFYTNYQYDRTRLDKVQTNGNAAQNSDASANVQYRYYANGLVQSITYPPLTDGSILCTEYTYNKALNWVESVTNRKDKTVLSAFSYGYDNNGNITSVTETRNGTTQTTTYAYDGLNRLIQTVRGGSAIDRDLYTYDVKGNRLTLESNKDTTGLFQDTSYSYDLLNTLTSLTKGSSKTDFTYYADGLRFKKVTGTNQTQYNYNFNGEVITEEKNGTQRANYVRGDRVLVKKDKNTSTDYYYLYNGHGDVVQIVNTSGTPVNSYSYDEWGNITSQTEGISNPFKYTGEIYDEETGLYYLRARYYDPSVGRFLNEDTYEGQINNPLSQNLYTYVHNNPLIYRDPTGHMVTRGADSIGADGGANVQYITTNDLKKLTQIQLSSIIADGSNSVDLQAAAMAEIIKRNFMLIENGGLRAASSVKSLINGSKKVTKAEESVNAVKNSAKGLIGKDFEDFLVKTLQGKGSFKVQNREFDGAVNNVWYEAKSGGYWDLITSSTEKLNKFKSDMGSRLNIATQNGASYELHSNTPIPGAIKDWLTTKGIKYTEW